MAELKLHKYHSLRNDFLLHFEDDSLDVNATIAKEVCDRVSGLGADGLIHISRDGESFRMKLWNADGSPAEMSGNGARCMAHSLVDRGWATEGVVHLQTDAGARWVNVGNQQHETTRRGVVNMGEATISDPNDSLQDLLKGTFSKIPQAVFVDVGNPHFVVNSTETSLEEFGEAAQSRFGNGINVELIEVLGHSDVVMQVFERGAGITQACGTGCVAVAAACLEWELTGKHVVVHQPGGDAEVEMRDNEWLLAADSVRVAEATIYVAN